jgi:hypothetical protein
MAAERTRFLRGVPGSGPAVSFYLHRLGQLEAAYRETAGRLLQLLAPDDDNAAAVRRVLDRFEH